MNEVLIHWEQVSLSYLETGEKSFVSQLFVARAQLWSSLEEESTVYIYIIYFACPVFVCLFASNKHQITEPIGPKFCVESHMNPKKDYELSKFSKLPSNKIRFSLKFENP